MKIIKTDRDKKRYLELLLLGDEQESMIDRYLEKGDMYVLQEEGKAAGVCVVTAESEEILELKNIAVAPEYQHQGLASRLMEHLIADAQEKGREGLILTCKDRLIGFYERFGYKNLGLSQSVHGGAVWYDMILEFPREK